MATQQLRSLSSGIAQLASSLKRFLPTKYQAWHHIFDFKRQVVNLHVVQKCSAFITLHIDSVLHCVRLELQSGLKQTALQGYATTILRILSSLA